MDVRFDDPDLDRLETDAAFTARLDAAVVRAFRKRMQAIRAASDERDFRANRSWHFEKLKGARQHQHSVRLNDQYRLIIVFEGQAPQKTVVIVAIEDYH